MGLFDDIGAVLVQMEADHLAGQGQEFLLLSTGKAAITGATNASPIVVTATAHGQATGDRVGVRDVLGNLAANGVFSATVIDANHLSLDGSAGSGNFSASPKAVLYSVYRGVPKALAPDALPPLALEDGTSEPQTNPLEIDLLPESFPGVIGDRIVYPAAGDVRRDRWRIGQIQPVYYNRTVFERLSLAVFYDPET